VLLRFIINIILLLSNLVILNVDYKELINQRALEYAYNMCNTNKTLT